MEIISDNERIGVDKRCKTSRNEYQTTFSGDLASRLNLIKRKDQRHHEQGYKKSNYQQSTANLHKIHKSVLTRFDNQGNDWRRNRGEVRCRGADQHAYGKWIGR